MSSPPIENHSPKTSDFTVIPSALRFEGSAPLCLQSAWWSKTGASYDDFNPSNKSLIEELNHKTNRQKKNKNQFYYSKRNRTHHSVTGEFYFHDHLFGSSYPSPGCQLSSSTNSVCRGVEKGEHTDQQCLFDVAVLLMTWI